MRKEPESIADQVTQSLIEALTKAGVPVESVNGGLSTIELVIALYAKDCIEGRGDFINELRQIGSLSPVDTPTIR